jgi:hypothetical protein
MRISRTAGSTPAKKRFAVLDLAAVDTSNYNEMRTSAAIGGSAKRVRFPLALPSSTNQSTTYERGVGRGSTDLDPAPAENQCPSGRAKEPPRERP